MFLLLTGMAFAEESVLIDFAELVGAEDGEHAGTLMDYSTVAGSSFSDDEKAAMKVSLAIENWEVELAGSSNFVKNNTYSLVKEAPVKETAKENAGLTVMGVRINFPINHFNSWALVKPPFEIPAYATAEAVEGEAEPAVGDKYVNKGVIKNVGVLKSLDVNVLGRNHPYHLSVVLEDENNEQTVIPVGYLDFDGWRTITWENPNYIKEVRNREIFQRPLYPKTAPLVKLIGILVKRDAAQEGGDFISYLKDVTITYDKAVLELESDIDDEGVWGILEEREEARRNAELSRLGNLQVLRYLESQKMHKEDQAN